MIYDSVEYVTWWIQRSVWDHHTVIILTGKGNQWTMNGYWFPTSFPTLASVQALMQTMTIYIFQSDSVPGFQVHRDFPSSLVKERKGDGWFTKYFPSL
jgi:hypothetical protein